MTHHLVHATVKRVWKSCCHRQSGLGSRAFRHYLGYGFARPVEWVCSRVPLRNKSLQSFSQRLFVGKISNTQTLALENAEPLLNLIHPGAMHWGIVKNKARVLLQPCLHFFALVHSQIIQHDVNLGDVGGNFSVEIL